MSEDLDQQQLDIPPHSLAAEMAVLGSILVDREMLDAVAGVVKPGDFYASYHSTVYRAMLKLASRHEPIDVIALAEHLRGEEQLDKIGGLAYLRQLTDTVPTSASAEYYARLVSEKSKLRRLITTGRKIWELGFVGEDDVDAALEQADSLLRRVLEYGAPKARGQSSSELFAETFRDIAARAEGEVEVGQSSPWPSLDESVGRFHPSEMAIWPAAPGTGKSGAMLMLADYVAANYGAVAFFSLEMHPRTMEMRHIALYSNVSTRRMRLGQTAGNDWDRIADAGNQIVDRPIYWYGKPFSRLADIRRELSRISKRERLAAFIIDHATFVADAESRGGDRSTLNERLERVYRKLLEFAYEFGCVAHVVAHFNRAAMKERPTLAGIRDGGNPEGNAHIIIAPYRPTADAPDAADRARAEFVILKAREGEAGSIPMQFHGWRSLWLETTPDGHVIPPWFDSSSAQPTLMVAS